MIRDNDLELVHMPCQCHLGNFFDQKCLSVHNGVYGLLLRAWEFHQVLSVNCIVVA